jgi:hypothetical protein
MEMLDGVSTSFSRDGTELTEMEGTELERVSLSQSLEANDFSVCGLRRSSRVGLPVPSDVLSSNSPRSNLLKSSTIRGNFRDSWAAQPRRGTGMAVACKIEASRSFKVLEDDCRVIRFLFGVFGFSVVAGVAR